MKSNLVLIRHGQSAWNKKNLFTGWTDVGLSQEGKEEARHAGLWLKKKSVTFDMAFSSALKRAIRTMEIILEELGLRDLPTLKAWQLNERHYGALQGQNRQEVIDKYGADQVQKWRRGFKTVPPPLQAKQHFAGSDLYRGIKQIPLAESLEDTQKRVLPFWEQNILPQIKEGKNILLSAHGNSLRALIKNLENISDEQIASVEIPTGRPWIYQWDSQKHTFSKTKEFFKGD